MVRKGVIKSAWVGVIQNKFWTPNRPKFILETKNLHVLAGRGFLLDGVCNPLQNVSH